MRMRQRAPNIMKQWAIFGGLMLALHAGVFVGWVALDPHMRRAPGLFVAMMAAYLVLLAFLMFAFMRRINRASSPPVYEEARAHGVPATAKVLSIEQTRWHTKRRRDFRLRSHPRRWEHVMRVRVSRPGEADYEAELAEYLRGADVPKKGAIIPVKVHSRMPEVVVMARD